MSGWLLMIVAMPSSIRGWSSTLSTRMLLWSFTWEFLSECGAISGLGDGFPGAVLTERWNSPGMAGARITEALCRKLIIGCYRARGQAILYEVDGIRTFLRKSESSRKLVRLRLAGRKSTTTQRYDIQPHRVEKFKISNDAAPPFSARFPAFRWSKTTGWPRAPK